MNTEKNLLYPDTVVPGCGTVLDVATSGGGGLTSVLIVGLDNRDYHTITLSHYHTITLSHYRTITLSHYRTITLSHYHTIAPSRAA